MPTMTQRATRRTMIVSIVLGFITANIVLSSVVALIVRTEDKWSSQATVVVLPRAAEPAGLAGLYETLSRGQVIATFAELIRTQEVDVKSLGSPADEVSIRVNVVPDTAIIAITATAPDARAAQEAATKGSDDAVRFIDELNQPYSVSPVSVGTPTSSGLPVPSLAAAGLIVALALGLAVQRASYHLLPLLPGRRANPSDLAPVVDPA